MTIMCVYLKYVWYQENCCRILQGQNVGQTQAPNKKTGPYKLALLRMFSQQTFAFLLTHCGCVLAHTNLMFELLLCM